MISENRVITAMSLYPGKTRQDVKKILASGLSKRIKLTALGGLLVLGSFWGIDQKTRQDSDNPYIIRRGDINDGDKAVDITFTSEQGGEATERLIIAPYEMTESDIEQMNSEVCEYLDGTILGENSGFDRIISDLTLEAEPEEYPVVIEWSSDTSEVLSGYGIVNNQLLQEPREVLLKGKIFYGDEFRLYERKLTVLPKVRNEEEQMALSGIQELKKLESENRNERLFYIPEKVGTVSVVPKGKTRVSLLGIGMALAMILVVYSYSNFFSSMETKRKRRLEIAGYDYKEFLSKLSLLLSAGMTLRLAWKKLAVDYSKGQKKKKMLAQNLAVSEREIRNGELEQTVYERFGERMENVAYQRLAQLLNQQVTKGVSNLSAALAAELKEVVGKEKESIKVRGEEAGTKLLLPMMGMLVIVFAILLMPAFTSF
ncbi:MAG: hypothetical protein MJ124_02320 [Lachnospiraceae bacterium]|nr:hypothetical protein [Lachnospiraceae bacterium]